MAEFDIALPKLLAHEGGYVNDPDDAGGETYKGISRRINSKWDGWIRVDSCKGRPGFPANLEKDSDLQEAIHSFYQVNFWDVLRADQINNQIVAESIFDFAVNAGVKTSSSLAQLAIDTTADGVIGPQTLEKLNAFDPEHFLAAFTVAKIARYVSIVKKKPTNRKYFFGWVCRAINE